MDAPMAEPQLQGQSLQASITVKDLDKSVAWFTGNVRLLLNKDDGAKGWERNGFRWVVSRTLAV
jgi:hypothetical protein